MEVIAIIVIGGLLARFLGGGGGGSNDRTGSTDTSQSQTKANNDWMRTADIDNNRRDRERQEADQRRRN